MEIFFGNVPFSVSETEFSVAFAAILHSAPFQPFFISGLPLNFRVTWFGNNNRRRGQNVARKQGTGLSGFVLLPTVEVAVHFLQLYGRPKSERSLRPFYLRDQAIHFAPVKPGRPPINKDIIAFLKAHPWEHPQVAVERERKAALLDGDVLVKSLEYGWLCRDGAFSSEWKNPSLLQASLIFNDSRRELRLRSIVPGIGGYGETRENSVVIRYAHIEAITLPHRQSESDFSICFDLRVPPSYEVDIIREAPTNGFVPRRNRLHLLHEEFRDQAPYVSLCVRLVCYTPADLRNFRRMSGVAGLVKHQAVDYERVERKLFAPNVLQHYNAWVAKLGETHWPIAFQCEAVLRSGMLDPREFLELAKDIVDLGAKQGSAVTSSVLRALISELRLLPLEDDDPSSIRKCFTRAVSQTLQESKLAPLAAHDSPLQVQKMIITPTTVKLSGPEPEQSNRVLRRYAENIDAFLRVTFADNDEYSYHYDREVDIPTFVKSAVGTPLKNGIVIAGRKFDFLAYSSSALKEHSVWFVTPFVDEATGTYQTAKTIRDGLGKFEKEKYCAARLGARMAQAFSATDPSVEVEEILPLGDIPLESSGPQCMTDGVGTMSRDFAEQVWEALESRRNKGRRPKNRPAPSAFQIRYKGAKGMLSVDYKLRGSVICLRPSMIKFEDLNSRELEIARAFNTPARMYLNRPLIVLLEGLGVKPEVFMSLQQAALEDIHKAAGSLDTAARMLESHGLGTAYRLPSLFASLHKLRDKHAAISQLLAEDDFFRRVLDFAINHIRRELKYKARIPVPQSWTLVGVVDVHGYLKEGEIFAAVKPRDAKKPFYLEGPMLITRSPVIHPGDVQVVRAIGRPPPGSPFVHEELPNCVVFSIKGRRSLASCLGGGDYDGDIYNVSPLRELHPQRCQMPAEYAPGKRKILDRPCGIEDIADFVTEYINSDLLGHIATNWLLIADASEQGIFHPDCYKLAQLHSDAVDYPKTGMPVPHRGIPQPKQGVRPDWHASELKEHDKDHYVSQKALGQLFRAIELPALSEAATEARAQRQQNVGRTELTVKAALEALSSSNSTLVGTPLLYVIRRVVREHGVALRFNHKILARMILLYNKYCSELLITCQSNTLSYSKNAQLTEEEVVAGTIVAKTHVARRRKEAIATAREQATRLVHGVKVEIAGDDPDELSEWLRRAWHAWELSLIEDKFGSRSWGWVCLTSVFEVIKLMDEETRSSK